MIYLILTFVGYILSLMTKEQAIILPLNLVLIDPIINLKGEKLTLQKAECMNQKRPRNRRILHSTTGYQTSIEL